MSQTKADIAREYRGKREYKNMPTLKLARIMYNDHKLLFTNIEDARQRLRYIEGKSGAKQKVSVKSTVFVKEEARPLNPYNLPETFEDTRKPYKLPVLCN